MRKLFLKAVLLVTAVWILGAIWIEAMPMAFYNFEYPMWTYQKRLVSSHLEKPPRVLVVGDSRALADILPAELD